MKTLFIFAIPLENQLPTTLASCDRCITGIGKINAAAHLSKALSEKTYDRVINLGICGCVDPNISPLSIFAVSRIMEGDRDFYSPKHDIVLPVLPSSTFPSSTLMTQDKAITRPEQRSHVSKKGATLVDMEGYALAKTAQIFKIPFYSFKIVSDHADENAYDHVRENIVKASQILCEQIALLLGEPHS